MKYLPSFLFLYPLLPAHLGALHEKAQPTDRVSAHPASAKSYRGYRPNPNAAGVGVRAGLALGWGLTLTC